MTFEEFLQKEGFYETMDGLDGHIIQSTKAGYRLLWIKCKKDPIKTKSEIMKLIGKSPTAKEILRLANLQSKLRVIHKRP